MLTLRQADPFDLIPLAALMDDYKHTFLDDYSEYSHDLLKQILASGECLIISDGSYPVGVIWFHQRVEDLHVKISILVRPSYLKSVIKQDIIPEALTLAFTTWNLRKIKAEPMKSQQTAIKLLKKYRFTYVAKLSSETKQNGKRVDVLLYELFKKNWMKKDNNNGIV